jgi:hypothetical protein
MGRDAVGFSAEFARVESAVRSFETPNTQPYQGRSTGEYTNFVGAESEVTAQRFREKIREIDKQKECLLREYYDFVDRAGNPSGTQTNYFPTPMTEVMNFEREFTVPRTPTVVMEDRETPHMVVGYRSMGDCHPYSQLSSRLADASLLTPRLVLVPESRSVRVSSGNNNIKAPGEVGCRATE